MTYLYIDRGFPYGWKVYDGITKFWPIAESSFQVFKVKRRLM